MHTQTSKSNSGNLLPEPAYLAGLAYFLLLALFSSPTFCQTPKKKKMQSNITDIQKWKKAVVHIEGATNSQDAYGIGFKLLQQGKITNAELTEIVRRAKIRDVRYTGTAIFMKRGDRHYLLTARHVLVDQLEINRKMAELMEEIKDNPTEFSQQSQQDRIDSIEWTIFSIIFRVPSLEESKLNTPEKLPPAYLMNLKSGPVNLWPFILSDPVLDLAVVSLNGRSTARFKKDLLTRGYVPINFEDIGTDLQAEGQEIMAVGFPGATSHVDTSATNVSNEIWQSKIVSVPIFSFGKIAMSNPLLFYYWADISIYPGNSGGPLISANKLVGIVSAQSSIRVEGNPALRTRIPFAAIIQAKYLVDLITKLDKKEESNNFR